MGRWAQAQRMGSASEIGRFYDYTITGWVDGGGFWRFNWLCSADPLRWEYRQWYFTGGIWVGPIQTSIGPSSRTFQTTVGIGIPIKAQLRAYTSRGFGAWTPELVSP